MSKKSYYDVLGVSPEASKAEIKQAYQKQTRKLGNKSRTNKKRAAIEDAYAILSDGRRRRAYDRKLGLGNDQPGATDRARPRRPVRSAWQLLRLHKWLFVRVGMIAIVVDWLLSVTAPPGGGTGQGLWLAIVLTVMVWTARQLHHEKNQLTARQAFYEGSQAFIKQFLLLLFWTVCLLPFIIGSLVYVTIAVEAFATTTAEQVVAGAVWLLLTIISVYFVIRTVFTVILVHETTPVDTIRRSWRMTRSRAGWLSARVLGWLGIAMLPVLGLYGIAESGLAPLGLLGAQALSLVADGLLFIVTLPILAVIIDQLYEHEKPRRTR